MLQKIENKMIEFFFYRISGIPFYKDYDRFRRRKQTENKQKKSGVGLKIGYSNSNKE